jgi:hypothetical protein
MWGAIGKGILKFASKKNKNLTKVFRGTEPKSKAINLSKTGMYNSKLSGRFFFDNAADARWYAQRQGTLTGKVFSTKIPKNYARIGRKMSIRRSGPRYGSELILPKKYVGTTKLDLKNTTLARLEATGNKIKKFTIG